MNTTLTSEGGYAVSELRTWLNGLFFASLPEDLQKVISPRTFKVVASTSSAAAVKTITDKVWLPRATEVVGVGGDLSYESQQGKTSIFPVYKSSGTKKDYRWWTATMKNTAGHWYWVDENGALNYSGTHNSLGVSPCFQIVAS